MNGSAEPVVPLTERDRGNAAASCCLHLTFHFFNLLLLLIIIFCHTLKGPSLYRSGNVGFENKQPTCSVQVTSRALQFQPLTGQVNSFSSVSACQILDDPETLQETLRLLQLRRGLSLPCNYMTPYKIF